MYQNLEEETRMDQTVVNQSVLKDKDGNIRAFNDKQIKEKAKENERGDSSAEILGETSAPDLVKEYQNVPNASTSSSLLLAQNPNPAGQTSSESQLETPTSSTTTLEHQKSTTMPPKINTSCTENQEPSKP
ncbi:hypothetical protein NC652_013038 [Populus alba x Populus x berolinensis]|nr:hypothetical protein NC652_013038 [Populus alba x Populus x berolinensis]